MERSDAATNDVTCLGFSVPSVALSHTRTTPLRHPTARSGELWSFSHVTDVARTCAEHTGNSRSLATSSVFHTVAVFVSSMLSKRLLSHG
jgi:hypothetical protein